LFYVTVLVRHLLPRAGSSRASAQRNHSCFVLQGLFEELQSDTRSVIRAHDERGLQSRSGLSNESNEAFR